MRVVIDATAIPVDRGGVGRYLESLLPFLQGDGVQVAVVCQERDVERFARLVPDVRLIVAPGLIASRAARLVWEQLELPSILRRIRPDVLHSPHYTMPLYSPVPVVVTLHDATFFTHPHLHSAVKARFFRQASRVAVQRAGGIVVPSLATQREIQREIGGSSSLFTVAHHGVDRQVFRPAAEAETRRVAGMLGLDSDQPYVAFLGTLEPRKNVPALIYGWIAAFEGCLDPPALVLAGGAGWDADVDNAVQRVPSHLRLVRPGYLPLEDLAGYLSGASIVAYPSLGEGFGLPVLEAMACGAAVVTTRELSLPEVGGDAVAYSGTDAGSIARALGALWDAPGLRAELKAEALRRAGAFSWEAAAETHRAAYRKALARIGRSGH